MNAGKKPPEGHRTAPAEMYYNDEYRPLNPDRLTDGALEQALATARSAESKLEHAESMTPDGNAEGVPFSDPGGLVGNAVHRTSQYIDALTDERSERRKDPDYDYEPSGGRS